VKIVVVPFCTILFALATQKNPFFHLENGKSFHKWKRPILIYSINGKGPTEKQLGPILL